jgi:hypothetical protein
MNRISLGNECASSVFLPKITGYRINTALDIEHSRAEVTVVTAPILPLYITCQAMSGLMLLDLDTGVPMRMFAARPTLRDCLPLTQAHDWLGWGQGLRGSRQAP